MINRRVMQEEPTQYPSWGMITFSLSVIALIIAVFSSFKQKEMAERCRILPK